MSKLASTSTSGLNVRKYTEVMIRIFRDCTARGHQVQTVVQSSQGLHYITISAHSKHSKIQQ